MHKAYINGIEGVGFLSSLTFPGVLPGPWDLSWEIRGQGSSNIRETWALLSFLPSSILFSVASSEQERKESRKSLVSSLCFLWIGVG